VIGVVLVLTAVGGLVARSIYQPGTAGATTPPTPAPPPSTDVTTTGTPESTDVKMSADAAASPYGSAVQTLLQNYYNAINDGSYLQWESTATPALIQANPEPQWKNGYASSQDKGMYVYRINSAPDNQLRVLLTFNSHQDPSKAPDTAPYACITWHSVLTMSDTKSGWKIDAGTAGSHPITEECAGS
jgi:hypothetical protein